MVFFVGFDLLLFVGFCLTRVGCWCWFGWFCFDLGFVGFLVLVYFMLFCDDGWNLLWTIVVIVMFTDMI